MANTTAFGIVGVDGKVSLDGPFEIALVDGQTIRLTNLRAGRGKFDGFVLAEIVVGSGRKIAFCAVD